jgi:hypothetical protein
MNLRKATFLAIALSMVAALVACSSSSSSTKTIAITASGGTPQSATVGAAFTTALQATVTSSGSPVSGVTVSFSVPSSGASCTPSGTTATTNSSGQASITCTANDTAGAYTVTASTTGATTSASFSLSNTSGAAASMSAVSGTTPQSAAVGAAFGTALAVTVVDQFSNPVNGVQVTFTAPSSGASGVFSDSTNNVTTATSGTNGVATAATFTANSTTGGPYNVVASATGLTSVNFALTNTVASSGGLAAGNYVFSVNGTDSGARGFGASLYVASGVISVDASGNIITGEMSFSDFNYYVQEAITSGSVAANPADSNLLITVNTGDTNIGPGATTVGGGSGTLVFDASMASATRGLLTEYDSWATSAGELNAQTSTAALCPSAPGTACGYSFFLGGLDLNGAPLGAGGVFTIDGASGGIDGVGSIFDVNDGGALSAANAFTASTVSSPDSMGYLTITLNSGLFTGSPGIELDGYIVDANHIRLVENWTVDFLTATTGGTALAQTGTGGFSSASISGATYTIGTPGADVNGTLQVAASLTFNSDGTVGGTVSFNDIVSQNAQGGTAITGGTWADDGTGTGRVIVTGATDGATFNSNLTVYQTGDGHATVLSMDAGDMVVGLGWQQASGLGVGSINGTYAITTDQFSSGVEFDGVGQAVADSATATTTGFLDENGSLLGSGLVPNSAFNSTYTGSSTSPVISITGNGGGLLTLYLVDTTQGVLIENDNAQLTFGYITNQ